MLVTSEQGLSYSFGSRKIYKSLMRPLKAMAWPLQNRGPAPKVFAKGSGMLAVETYLLLTGSQTSIWRVRAPLLTVLWAKEGTALQGRLLRLSPLNGLAATGAAGQDTMEAVRAAIAPISAEKEPRIPGARGDWQCKALYVLETLWMKAYPLFHP